MSILEDHQAKMAAIEESKKAVRKAGEDMVNNLQGIQLKVQLDIIKMGEEMVKKLNKELEQFQ